MKTRFTAGDRVRVSDDFFWAKGAIGRVSSPPDEVRTLSGGWDGLTRLETSAVGKNIVYWVWFDQPQYDADGGGPYRGGQIWESALNPLTSIHGFAVESPVTILTSLELDWTMTVMFSIAFTEEPLEYPYDDIGIPAAPDYSYWEKVRNHFWRTYLYGTSLHTNLIGGVN